MTIKKLKLKLYEYSSNEQNYCPSSDTILSNYPELCYRCASEHSLPNCAIDNSKRKLCNGIIFVALNLVWICSTVYYVTTHS